MSAVLPVLGVRFVLAGEALALACIRDFEEPVARSLPAILDEELFEPKSCAVDSKLPKWSFLQWMRHFWDNAWHSLNVSSFQVLGKTTHACTGLASDLKEIMATACDSRAWSPCAAACCTQRQYLEAVLETHMIPDAKKVQKLGCTRRLL